MIRSSPSLFRGARRFAFLTSLMLVLSGCSLLSSSEEQVELPSVDYETAESQDLAQGGTLTLGAEYMPNNFNTFHTDGVDSDAPYVLAPTTGSAVRVRADGSWEVDKNYARSVSIVDRKPLVVEVELEPKAVWEDGTPIRANDMVSFVKAMKNSRFSSDPHPAMADIDSVDVTSDTKYRVKFKRVNADWPAVIYPGLPRSATSSEKVFNTAFKDRAVSSNGPFKVTLISAETSTIRLEKNPRWWGAAPALSEIVWRFAEPNVLAQAFELNELDVTPISQFDKKSSPKDAKLRVAASSYWSQITLNAGRGPLKDAKVRQAVALAIDRKAFADDLKADTGWPGRPLDTVVTVPGQVGHEAVGTKRDLEKARNLLEQAGWKNLDGKATKDKKQLQLILPIPEKQESAKRRAALIASQLSGIGIEVKTDVVAADTFYEKRVITLDFDLVTFTHQASAFNTSPSRLWFTPRDSPQNFTGTATSDMTKAFTAVITELDREKRTEASKALEDVVADQASIVPLVVIPSAWLVREGVVNFGPTQFEQLDWTKVAWHKDFQEK